MRQFSRGKATFIEQEPKQEQVDQVIFDNNHYKYLIKWFLIF